MRKNKKVPEIRFKGFTEDWEQRKLGELLSLENGYAFKSDYFVEKDTGIVVTTPGNVNIDGGFNVSGGNNYLAEGPYPARFVFKPGDLFVTMTDLTPSANTLGKPAIVPNNKITYLHNQRLGKLVNYEGSKKFLFSLLCTGKYHSRMVKTASGTTVRHSSPDRILNYETYFPKNDEQKKIGHFFANIDKLIILQQQKIERLVNVKKSMLEKMFPHNFSKKPAIRFKNYSKEWEQHKLGEMQENGLLQLKRGNIIPKQSGLYPVYSSSAIGKGLFCTANTYMFDEEKVTWSIDGGGKVFYRPKHKFSVTNVCGYVDIISDSLDCKYLSLAIEKAWSQITFDYVVKAHPSVISELYDISIPCYEEQKAIGKIFKSIDNLIDLYQRKLEKLNNIKKSMLDKMFV